MTKISYLDETLKRLPILLVVFSGIWYGVTKLNSIEMKIERLEILTSKDKEQINSRIEEVFFLAKLTSNKTNEVEKKIVRINAILTNNRLKIEDDDNN